MLRHFKAHIKKHGVKYFVVSLFGGEPMHDANMCQTIVLDLRELEKEIDGLNIQIAIITNGTLYTKENVDFFVKEIDSIQITLDGTEDIHDKFRIYSNGEGSFKKIIENLKLIKEVQHRIGKKSTADICIRVNVNSDTVEHARVLVDYLVDNDLSTSIGALEFHEIFGTQGDVIENGGDPEVKNIDLAKQICDLNFYVLTKGIPVSKELSEPCIAKMAAGYAIDENLNVYGCPGLIYSDIHGNLDESGEINIFDKTWYDYQLNDPKCIDGCRYSPICYGGCNWARGEKENDCFREVYDATIVLKLQAYIMSKYACHK